MQRRVRRKDDADTVKQVLMNAVEKGVVCAASARVDLSSSCMEQDG